MPPRRKRHIQATFGPRGQAMWDALAPTLGVAQRVLLDEGCRIADRLDALARLLAGDVDSWATIRDARTDELPSELIVNSAMAEARMSATVLRQIVAELTPAAGGAVPAAEPSAKGGSISSALRDELAARRAAPAASGVTAS